VGFTVYVYVVGAPLHPLALGVIVIVDVTGLAVVLIALNDEIFPVPEAARPMDELEFVQVNVVPETPNAELNETAVVAVTLQFI
jgi:hypothetical protein